ncbi:helix-turn-helix transcriptional regulator [Streptomyces sp. AM 2-1-1]|uniref:helix-turn-helix domain-containing protein n=1 Tax=Streptomyces sp. AM 2-1-1 TaxID=3028709 RepID=UPI0023B8E46F|nr:helix-turn-helix transcriptional regulator [Streptomyces sp. AM 2-1-1]WEH40816.1 helix-turn-helix transcriptional regulator [Streptomyces sp. AM 2-1-1]
MRARFRLRAREAWRHAHGWTLQHAGERLEQEAARAGETVAADASLVAKWEKWPGPSARRPSVAVLTALARAYGCTVEQLLDLDDWRALPPAEAALLRRPHPAMPDTPTADPAPIPNPEPTGVSLIHTAADESAAWAQWAEATNVGPLALEQLLADTRGLAADYLTQDPAGVFRSTRRLRDRVWALLEGRQYPAQSRDLYVAAGYLCALLAWMSSDFGQLRDADTHGRTAMLCAELAGDHDLHAWVCSTRSKIALWDGRLRDAVLHARRGGEHARTGSVAVLLACQEADSWSLLGARAEAVTALHRADEAEQRAASLDDVGGLFSCPPVRHANYVTATLLRTGDPAGALRTAEAAFGTQPAHSYGTTAQMQIAMAQAHLALQDTDGAGHALHSVFDLPADHRLEPVTVRMRDLSASMARTRAGGAAGVRLRGQIDAWCADSAPRYALSPGGSPS